MEKTILEGNKLIAEFMKFDSHLGNVNIIACLAIPEYDFNKLPYHSSWDWLMPVVEKIEQLDGLYISVKIHDSICDIIQHIPNGRTKLLFQRSGGEKIQCTWQAVVEFVKWYNLQTK